MNPVKLSFAAIVIFTLLAVETDSTLHRHRHLYRPLGYGLLGLGAAPLALTPALIPVYLAVAPRRHVSLLLLLKLLALKKTLLIATPAVAVGSLVVGSGAGLLAGKLGALAMLRHVEPYKHMYHYYKHKHGGGWGVKPTKIKGHHRVAGYFLSVIARQAHRTVNWVKRVRHSHKYFKAHRPLVHGWSEHVHAGHGHGHYEHSHHDHGHGHYDHSHHIPTHYDDHARSHRHIVPTHYHATQSPGYGHDHGYSEAHYSHTPAEYYTGGHPTEDTSNHGLSFNSGPPYLTSGDVVVDESEVNERVAKPGPEKPAVPKTTQAEYIAGVLSHVAPPITDFINGVTTVLGGNAYKPTVTTKAEPIDPNTGKPWEFPGLSAKESEQYLEQHFEQLKSQNPEEGMSLIRVLREAYSQTLADLGFKDENKIPDFVPIPMSEEDKESRRQAKPQLVEPQIEEQAIDYDVSKEVGQFFALISSFDNETCFQKLVCDVHTRVNETTAENFTPYEENLLAVFRMLGTVLNEDVLDHTTAKYLAAAKYGAENESSELCQVRYPDCPYSSNEIMDMGIELENESSFSIPGYLVSKLGNTLNERQAQQLLNIRPIEDSPRPLGS